MGTKVFTSKILPYKLNDIYKDLRILFETHEFFIAGGYLRDMYSGGLPNDIDIFFHNKEDYEKACFEINRHKDYEIFKTRGSSTQYIKKDYDFSKDLLPEIIDMVFIEDCTPESIINGFDFTVCCILFDGLHLHYSVEFHRDILNKELKINTISLPYHSISRVGKFKKRAYRITTETELQLLDYAYKAPWGPGKEAEYNEDTQ